MNRAAHAKPLPDYSLPATPVNNVTFLDVARR